jgi:hypothetical protein
MAERSEQHPERLRWAGPTDGTVVGTGYPERDLPADDYPMTGEELARLADRWPDYYKPVRARKDDVTASEPLPAALVDARTPPPTEPPTEEPAPSRRPRREG